ncbi:MAG TPA: hypothetical protein VGF85_12375 [Opitutaceae bacterium]|jgi:hypothetical protein
MSDESQEPALPYTPSNTGRRSRAGYLGFDGVSFNELWPLFTGVAASAALSLALFVGREWEPLGWEARTALALAPAAAGYAYLRFLVSGKPPHYKGDLWTNAAGLAPEWPSRHPVLCVLPRIRCDGSSACGPARAADEVHPRSRGRR